MPSALTGLVSWLPLLSLNAAWRATALRSIARVDGKQAVNALSPSGRKLPVVHVQDLLPYFPREVPLRLSTLNLSMDEIYGDPVCAGSAANFISDERHAPIEFCRYTNNQVNMAMVGKKTDDFDQYAMERIMLGKWRDSPLRCRLGRDVCSKNADIVVVPSLSFHNMVQENFTWPISGNATAHGGPGTGAFPYWNTVRELFYKPDLGRTPLIVVHSPFAWNWPSHNEWLHALSKQPPGFVEHVVIATTGSNLKPAERAYFPERWSDSASELLARRARERHDGTYPELESRGPLMVTVPYPTSLLKEVRWTDSTYPYLADRKRRISVSLFASTRKSGRGANWVREDLMDLMETKKGSNATRPDVRTLCSDAAEEALHEELCGIDAKENMWTITANSMFCIEPPGDTLCRSHFYISVLSGCIPVIIDGGHESFISAPTWWAWRGADDNTTDGVASFDYRSFSVVYDAEDVKQRGADVLKELEEMPDAQPHRFQALRERLDQVAPLMRYSREKCSSYPLDENNFSCRDAFSIFQRNK